MAVLDGNFSVRGVAGLRVIDASSWPNVPGYFITTPTYMVSSLLHLMKSDAQSSSTRCQKRRRTLLSLQLLDKPDIHVRDLCVLHTDTHTCDKESDGASYGSVSALVFKTRNTEQESRRGREWRWRSATVQWQLAYKIFLHHCSSQSHPYAAK